MSKKEKKIILILNILLVLIDQISKILYINISHQEINLSIKNIFNSNNISYILVSIIVVSTFIRYILKNNQFIKLPTRIIISFAISGGIGNLIDRLWNANVISINLKKGINLNLSYVYICVAWVGMAVVLTVYTSKRIRNKKRSSVEK